MAMGQRWHCPLLWVYPHSIEIWGPLQLTLHVGLDVPILYIVLLMTTTLIIVNALHTLHVIQFLVLRWAVTNRFGLMNLTCWKLTLYFGMMFGIVRAVHNPGLSSIWNITLTWIINLRDAYTAFENKLDDRITFDALDLKRPQEFWKTWHSNLLTRLTPISLSELFKW